MVWAVGAWLVGSAADAESSAGDVLPPGAIDLHCHTAPDVVPRPWTDLEVVQRAHALGLRAVVLKSHVTATADRAALAAQQVPGIDVFGGVVLNRAVGGLNSAAIEAMVQMAEGRGRLVWLPTRDALHEVRRRGGREEDGVAVVRDGAPLPELLAVIAVVARHDLVLATGHCLADETRVVLQAAAAGGVRRMVVTHALSPALGATPEHLREFAELGALIELSWLHFAPPPPPGPDVPYPDTVRMTPSLDPVVQAIATLGAEVFVLSSDLSRPGWPSPPDGLRDFAAALRAAGVGDEAIATMAVRNPARLLGLP
jgi:hypothetical protein